MWSATPPHCPAALPHFVHNARATTAAKVSRAVTREVIMAAAAAAPPHCPHGPGRSF
jgi:hypothetical protein